MTTVFYLIIFIICMVAVFECGRIVPNHRTKSFMITFCGLWTALYAGLIPAAASMFGFLDQDYIGYYEFSALILLGSFLVLLLIIRAINIRDVDTNALNYRNILCFTVAALTVALIFPESWLTNYLRPTTILPGSALLYALARSPRRLVISLIFHVLVIFDAFNSNRIVDSKEVIVASFVGPPLFAHTFNNYGIRAKSGILLFFASTILYLIAQPVVAIGRQGHDVDAISTVTQIPENFRGIAEASLERMLVLDALARTLDNEFSSTPLRPSNRLWTLVGWVTSIFPALFERPNLAKEALIMTKYTTSHDDVNIAVTYAGSILWSYGIFFMLPVTFIFWYLILLFIKLGSRLNGNLVAIFILGFGFILFRLEALAVNILSAGFILLTYTFCLNFLIQIIRVRR